MQLPAYAMESYCCGFQRYEDADAQMVVDFMVLQMKFNSFFYTLTCRIIVALLLLIFAIFSQGYSLIRKATFINFQ